MDAMDDDDSNSSALDARPDDRRCVAIKPSQNA
jgi:hypothetical protein